VVGEEGKEVTQVSEWRIRGREEEKKRDVLGECGFRAVGAVITQEERKTEGEHFKRG